MSKTFSDRLLLRKIKHIFNKKPFEAQNKLLSKISNVCPEWFHQSRINYRYIYSNLNTYWPEWMKAQFNPFDTNSSPPLNEFTCLNTSAQSMFKYTPANNKKAAFIINEDGYISFPNQLWGLTFKVEIDQMELADPFYKKITLDPVQSTIKADVIIEDVIFSLTIGYDSQLNIRIGIKNTSELTKKIKLMCGILPYTEEGVGFLSQIQYSTDQQFIINDESVLAFSDQPDNILCASYVDGNIFELESNWEMVMQAKCPLGMCSGIATYMYELPSKKDVSLDLKTHHSDAFFTPLIKPIQKLIGFFKQFKYTPFSAESLTLPVDTLPFNFQIPPQNLSKVQLVIHNFLLQMNQPIHAKNMETIYYTTHSLLRVGAKSYIDQFLMSYITDSKQAIFKEEKPHILLPSQQKLITDILIIVLINSFKFNSTIINQKFATSVEKRIKKDPFITFIQKINLNQFNNILNDSRGYSFSIKLFIYHSLLKQILLLKIDTSHLAPIKLILDNYINIIQKDSAKLALFIDNFYNSKQLQISSKLFIADVFLKDIDSDEFPVTKLVNSFNQNWIRQRFSDHLNHHEFSEKNELMFSRLSHQKQFTIIKNYLKKVNNMGFYFDKKCDYNLFSIFPRQIKSFHNIFITSFFDLILSTKNNTLFINIAQHLSENTSITNLHTVFGKISLELEQREKYDGLRLRIIPEFHRPPQKIICNISEQFKFYSIDNFSKSPNQIKNKQVEFPIQSSQLYLY